MLPFQPSEQVELTLHSYKSQIILIVSHDWIRASPTSLNRFFRGSMTGTYDTQAAREIALNNVIAIFNDLGVAKLYVKKLAPNDNSKNQPYFGGHLSDLAFIPTGEPVASPTTSKKSKADKRQIKYQAPINFSWVDAAGKIYPAPNTKLIYYPQYPEVRLSGFLQGSPVQAGEWMDPYKQGRSLGRWLILGAASTGKVYAYLVTPECALSKELESADLFNVSSVFSQIDIHHSVAETSTRGALIAKLTEIHNLGWIPSQKLNKDMTASPYKAQNGGGYTLEAKLGVTPNGFAEPDYLGWEVKQFGVTKFPATGAKPTTLMTPEPDGGIYVSDGAEAFVRQYGYADKSGKKDRINFGGKHIANKAHALTGLKMTIAGFDSESSHITDAQGAIALVDGSGTIAASWSFAKIMGHWKTKHAQAVYVPCIKRSSAAGANEYHYGNNIELGTGTNFEQVLACVYESSVYYDPGIKLEDSTSAKPKLKRRSQFRIAHQHLNRLYTKFELVDILKEGQ